MTALTAVKQGSGHIRMSTWAQVIMLGGRIVQIDIAPTGESTEEDFNCECIYYDALSHQEPVCCKVEEGTISFSCDSGIFLFHVECDAEVLAKVGKCLKNGFCLQKKNAGSGFSLLF